MVLLVLLSVAFCSMLTNTSTGSPTPSLFVRTAMLRIALVLLLAVLRAAATPPRSATAALLRGAAKQRLDKAALPPLLQVGDMVLDRANSTDSTFVANVIRWDTTHAMVITKAVEMEGMSEGLKQLGAHLKATDIFKTGGRQVWLWNNARIVTKMRLYRPCCFMDDRCGNAVPLDDMEGQSVNTCSAGVQKAVDFLNKTVNNYFSTENTVEAGLSEGVGEVVGAAVPGAISKEVPWLAKGVGGMELPSQRSHSGLPDSQEVARLEALPYFCSALAGTAYQVGGLLQKGAMKYDMTMATPRQVEEIILGRGSSNPALADVPPSVELLYESDPGSMTRPGGIAEISQTLPWRQPNTWAFEVLKERISCMPASVVRREAICCDIPSSGPSCVHCGALQSGMIVIAHHAGEMVSAPPAEHEENWWLRESTWSNIYLQVDSLPHVDTVTAACVGQYVLLLGDDAPSPELDLRIDLSKEPVLF